MESGTLSSHPPSELLRALASLRATGCLRLLHGDTTATMHFRDGLVYTASAPAARTRLGDRLVGAGHITEEQLASTLALQRSLAQPRRIGELLIERGLIDRETMRSYVREQIADSVAATLRWTQGEWTFSEGEEVAEDAPLDMSVENLLMEGARRLEEWGAITARLGSIDTIVDFAPDGSAAELSLTPDEWSMLTRIDGASTIAEIAEEAGYSQFEAARIIYGLLTAGVVTVVGDEADGDADDQVVFVEEPGTMEDGDVGIAWDPTEWEPASALTDEPLADPAQGSPRPPDRPPDMGTPAFDVPPPVYERPAPATVPPPAADRPPAADVRPPTPGRPSEGGPPSEPPRDVNRNELLREFAALDDEDEDSGPLAPPPRSAPPRPVEPPRDSGEDRRDRRGIFRRRRD